MSDEAKAFRQRWFESVKSHTVLRYVDALVPGPATDD